MLPKRASLERRRPALHQQTGLTLVELMITLTIGMIVVAAMSALFIGSTTTRREVASTADTIENGRYAIDLLTRELSLAGFSGTLRTPSGASTVNIPCSNNLADWRGSFGVFAFGWNQDEPDPACLTDRKPGTDAIFIQRVSTCSLGDLNCDAESTANAYLQVPECTCVNVASCSADPKAEVIDAGNSGNFTRRTKMCNAANRAPIRRIVRRIYFVNTNDVLMYREISLSGTRDQPLAENIEQLQFSYAVDANGNGTLDSAEGFQQKPGALWANVLGVRVWVLTRSATQDDKPSATPSFQLDDLPASAVDVSKQYRRRVSTTYIPFIEPTWRSISP